MMDNKYNRPVWVEINLSNFEFNLKEIKKRISSNTLLNAVVKADGYGHGAVKIAKKAAAAGADRLSVALPDEGIELREAGINLPIHLLGEVVPEQIEVLIEYDLIPAIAKFSTAEKLNQLCAEKGLKKKVHIIVDTGMGRIGLSPKKAPVFIEKVTALPNLELEGLMTHFAKADEADKKYTLQQFSEFKKIITALEKKGIDIPIKHCANSAAVIDLPEMQLDMVRAGIMIYGLRPSKELEKKIELKEVLSWKAKIIYLKELEAGKGISYGAEYITKKREKIATIPLGYADGYFRLLSNQADVLIRGQRAPIRGRVCMDQFMVGVDQIKDVELGDEVVLIGNQAEEKITADELAEKSMTINYEIVSKITKRVPRVYIE